MSITSLPFASMTDPDTTYFSNSDCRPETDGKSIFIYNGSGVSKAWGRPNVSSRIVYQDDQIVHIEVTGWHKHTRFGPVRGDYYFVRNRGGWKRTTANNKIVRDMLDL